jgi:integrase
MASSSAALTLVVSDRTQPIGGGLVPVALVDQARAYAAEAKAPATRRAYRGAWQAWGRWAAAHGLAALPAAPEAVACYVSALAAAGRRVPSLELALAALAAAHQAAGHPSPRSAPVVREVMQGIRRAIGVAPQPKAPVRVPELRAMLATTPAGLLGLRDQALLLVGFASALRRAELVALDVADVVTGPDGLTITLRRSKTDQEGAGRPIGVPFGSAPAVCPVRALAAWLAAAGITEGAIFRGVSRHGALLGRLSDRGVARVVQRGAAAVGLEASAFGGHSLRAGLATAAATAGKSERAIMAQTGHRSAVMVRRYIRTANLFTDNAAAGLL